MAIYVTWNAINQTVRLLLRLEVPADPPQLPIEEQGKHPEPSRFWAGPNMKKLTHFDATVSQPPPLGTTVVFRDDADINSGSPVIASAFD